MFTWRGHPDWVVIISHCPISTLLLECTFKYFKLLFLFDDSKCFVVKLVSALRHIRHLWRQVIELCGHPMMDALAHKANKTNTPYINTTNANATNTFQKLCGNPIRDAQPQKPNTTKVHKYNTRKCNKYILWTRVVIFWLMHIAQPYKTKYRKCNKCTYKKKQMQQIRWSFLVIVWCQYHTPHQQHRFYVCIGYAIILSSKISTNYKKCKYWSWAASTNQMLLQLLCDHLFIRMHFCFPVRSTLTTSSICLTL